MRAADFPSDALSVKRLRQIFPKLFDKERYSYGSFFYPIGVEQPSHLVRLHELVSAEREVADCAYHDAIGILLDEGIREDAGVARKNLEQLYVEFKLADSPETARLLIRQVEEQGAQQGKLVKSRRAR